MNDTRKRSASVVTRRRFLALGMAAGAGLMLSSCGSDDGPRETSARSGESSSESLQKVKLGMVASINSADVYLGKSLGFYEKHGLDAELITFQNPTKMRDALISGEIDLSAQAPLHVYLAQSRDVPLKVVANRRNTNDIALVARANLADEIADVADLKGRSIGVSAVGGWDWAVAVSYLQEHGLDPENDVQFVGRSGTSALALLKSNQIDAAASNPPDLTQIIEEGVGQYLIDPSDPETHLRYFQSHTAMTRAWLTHQRVIDDKPDVVAGAVEAANDVFAYFHDTAVEEVARAIAANFDGIDTETLERAIGADLVDAIPRTVALSRAAYDADQRVFVQAGVVEEAIPFDTGVDGTWAGVED